MNLSDLGYYNFSESTETPGFVPGRVIAEHKERYIVTTGDNEYEAEVTGNLRYTANGREDFPAVGDWVALSVYDSGNAIIHKIFPRFSVLKRQAVGKFGEVQVIAANVDFAFLVQATDRDFSINRLERYMTICNSSGIKPVIVLTKTDLVDAARLNEITGLIKSRIKDIPLFSLSNETHDGYDAITRFIEKGMTYCMLGSSGVGKSTLLNNLSGRNIMETGEISSHTNRGRHITSHRELTVLESGGILIDNPGMREVGIADSEGGLELTFDAIQEFAVKCRFPDCTHTSEKGCAVLEAVEKGLIDSASYENYLKMLKEKAYFESTVAERRMKDKKFGKMVKHFLKDKENGKF